MSDNPNDGPGAPISRAEEMQMDACLAELAGAGPAPDLADRILAAARDRSPQLQAQRQSRWLAAAVLVVGVTVVAAVAWMQRQQEQPAVAPLVEEPQEQQKPPDQQQPPAPGPQDPEQQLRIFQWIRDLEDPQKRDAALAALQQEGHAALQLLEMALKQEQVLRLPDVLEALKQAHGFAKKSRVALPQQDLFESAEPVTVVADYSDNRVSIVNDGGKLLWEMRDVFGAWDAELTHDKTLLITEFSVSRVREVDRRGNVLWFYDDLKNPYDADRLPGGNTLIADTFGGRVIEVSKDKQVVWELKTVHVDGWKSGIRPFDADRLPNGNTLIADVLLDKVLEVNRDGKVVWQVDNMNNVHDADRLPNGNTLITLRSAGKVIEVDKDGKVVWQLANLESPGDADRLPNGNTLVAENKQVREFDKDGKQVWNTSTWAVEVNRY